MLSAAESLYTLAHINCALSDVSKIAVSASDRGRLRDLLAEARRILEPTEEAERQEPVSAGATIIAFPAHRRRG